MDDKVCVTCHELRPVSAFNKRAAAKDGLQARCRLCSRAWYVANSETHKANTLRRTRLARRALHGWLAEYLHEHPCVDCGEDDIRCLDFDHVDPTAKTGTIARMIREPCSLRTLAAEIAKCEVRCANCHRKRTGEMFGSWRQEAWSVESAERALAAAERLRQIMSSCQQWTPDSASAATRQIPRWVAGAPLAYGEPHSDTD